MFDYLSGNGDLHAKNLAIMKDARGEWRVTTAYDLPSSAICGDRTMALAIDGKIRQQLSWTMLQGLGQAIGIPSQLAAEIVREQTAAAGTWIERLTELTGDASRIRIFQRLVNARIRHIQPDP